MRWPVDLTSPFRLIFPFRQETGRCVQSLVLMVALFGLLLCDLLPFESLQAAETVRLDEPADDFRVFGVGLRVEVKGKLLTSPDSEKSNPLNLNLSAVLSFRERRLVGIGKDAESLRSVRDYEQCRTQINVQDQPTQHSLDDSLKLVVAQGKPDGVEFYSLGGFLSGDELELLRAPCDTQSMLALLPGKEVEVGESWKPANWVAQFITSLEAVSKSELTCKLTGLANGIAKIEFEGSAEGAVLGAGSEIKFNGSMEFDTNHRCVVKGEYQQTEKRSVGVISPGLEFSSVVRLQRLPAQDPGRLGVQRYIDAAVEDVAPEWKRIRFDASWKLGLLHDRNWRLFHQTEAVAIFRRVEDGIFVSQCNMSPVGMVGRGQHTSEEVFKADIRKSLGERFTSFTSSETVASSEGYFIYRVVVNGKSGERPLMWIYYLIAEQGGQQASMMFSLDTKQVPRFGDEDRKLVGTFRFGAAPAAAIVPASRSR